MSPKFTDIKGVFAEGIHCGIKTKKKDMALIYLPKAYSAAGVFTQNSFAAPSILHTQKVIKKGQLKAILINSGNANAGVGEQGQKDCKAMAREAANALGLNSSEVAVASTGIIGVPLPMDTVLAGINKIAASAREKNAEAAAEAILTTDTFTKTQFSEETINGKVIKVAGISKGSGMIHPNMATTLSFMVTNAKLKQAELQRMFKVAIDKSFNMISVDTDTSTSDMALLVSTGEQALTAEEKKKFQAQLNASCIDLAKQVAKDGEGASKLIEVTVNSAVNDGDAAKIAKSIICSPLVKTAIYGEDANWGRILAAAGKVEAKLNPNKVDIGFMHDGKCEWVFCKGQAISYNESHIQKALKSDTVNIQIELNLNSGTAQAWGCDLTEGYIKINTAYN